MQKFIFITGAQDDVLSRSFVSSATASLLAARGFSIKLKKLSPLMNVNFALSDPAECGEIFLTADGTETDGELGRMERFSQVAADSLSFITMGELLRSVLNKESFGSYLGKPVKTEPHLTDEILSFVTKTLGKQPDIILCAVGGREDDIEALPYFKAIKIAKESFCEGSVLHIHVQNAKNKLVKNSLLSPDVIVSVKSHFENNGENEEETVSACDKVFETCMENPYLLPVELEKKGFAAEIIKKLGLQDFKPNIAPWRQFAEKAESSQKEVKIAICGKYLPNTSAYLSLTDGLISGGVARGIKVVPEFVAADDVTDETAKELFANAKGIVIADGRAERGIQGLAAAVRYAMQNNVAFLAIGSGMHMAATELAVNVLGLKGAASAEFSSTAPYLIAVRAEEFRLGTYRCHTIRNTNIYSAYGRESFEERMRTGYVLNNAYRAKFEENGIYFVGMTSDGKICTAFEIPEKKWFTAVQFLPEYGTSILKPNPILSDFISAASEI